MKDSKAVLSVQIEKTSLSMLKEICIKEKRSQAKMLEVLIEQEHDKIKVGK